MESRDKFERRYESTNFYIFNTFKMFFISNYNENRSNIS